MKPTTSLSFRRIFFKVLNIAKARSSLDMPSIKKDSNENQTSTSARVDIIRSKGKEIAYYKSKYAIPEKMPQLELNKCVTSVVKKGVTSHHKSWGLHDVLTLSPSRIPKSSTLEYSSFLTMTTVALGMGLQLWWAMLPDIILYSNNHGILFDNIVVSNLIESMNCAYRSFCEINPMPFYEGAAKCLHTNNIHDLSINALMPRELTIPQQVEEFVDVEAESCPTLTDRQKALALILAGYMIVILLNNDIYFGQIVEMFLTENAK